MDELNFPAENRRIKEIMEKEGCTPSSFADTINIDRATISNILNGRTDAKGVKYFPPPSLAVTQQILNTYKNINPAWLLLGTLPMYKSDKMSLAPDLFDENSINAVRDAPSTEYVKEIKVEKTENAPKNPVIQEVIPQINTSRKTEKIIVFFSDNTFESFSPDK